MFLLPFLTDSQAAVGVADHFIPGVGAAVSAYKTVDDAVNGDWCVLCCCL